jgi:hypothetical protein
VVDDDDEAPPILALGGRVTLYDGRSLDADDTIGDAINDGGVDVAVDGGDSNGDAALPE